MSTTVFPKSPPVSKSGLRNYYGEVVLHEIEGRHFLGLADHCRDAGVLVSEAFAAAFVAEFGGAR